MIQRLTFLFILFSITSCTWKENVDSNTHHYPNEIGNIMVKRCATTGCHNQVSHQAAGGLLLDTWENLFEGSWGGAAVVPYRPNESFLMYFLHQDNSITPVVSPQMPINEEKLSTEEVWAIYNWIEEGAPDYEGNIKFSSKLSKSKLFVTNQGCDMMAVFDTESKNIMRVFDVGNQVNIESPHFTKISPDGESLYMCFTAGNTLQKFNANNHELIGEAIIGQGNWNTFALNSDGSKAFVVDWDPQGRIAVVDLAAMTLEVMYQGSGFINNPHGSKVSPNDQYLYITAQTGNFVYKIDISDIEDPDVQEISMETGVAPNYGSSLDIHEIEFSPNGNKYYVTCQRANEVRVIQSNNDSLLKVIPTGTYPSELAFSEIHPYLFVTNPEDTISFPDKRGSVQIINYETDEVIKTLFTGYQPHGIAIDDEEGIVYLANRNQTTEGPAPHHATDCGGKNGYLTIIDLNTLELVPGYKYEVLSDPYSIVLRK